MVLIEISFLLQFGFSSEKKITLRLMLSRFYMGFPFFGIPVVIEEDISEEVFQEEVAFVLLVALGIMDFDISGRRHNQTFIFILVLCSQYSIS